jgi:hypothetical protein
MKKTFEVYFKATTGATLEVEAESKEQARELAEEMIAQGEFEQCEVDADDYEFESIDEVGE